MSTGGRERVSGDHWSLKRKSGMDRRYLIGYIKQSIQGIIKISARQGAVFSFFRRARCGCGLGRLNGVIDEERVSFQDDGSCSRTA